MLAPIMHMVDVYNYSFFVPDRLAMERNKFEIFITGGKNGDGKDALGNTIEIPYVVFNRNATITSSAASISWDRLIGNPTENLMDFLGLTVDGSQVVTDPVATFKINMMPVIQFWRIWNEYFRDQNLHPDVVDLYPGIFEATGNITAAVYAALTNATVANRLAFFSLPYVCWEKDYFTSALPFAQRGNPVETPLTGSASVTYKPSSTIHAFDNSATAAGTLLHGTLPASPAGGTLVDSNGGGKTFRVENIDEIELSTGGFTINQLRLASRLQEWLEKMARGGSRYIEQIKMHFGVTSSDARLQRPEFLGGGKIPVHISEVLQTAPDPADVTPLADMSGHGVTSGKINNFGRFFEEHGRIISIMFMRPRTAYLNGVPREWTHRFDKLDWAWPSFAHLGEQEIANSEIYATFGPNDAAAFGYQSRYAEYKYIPSTVHGAFRFNLNFWHWSRIFETAPTLSKEFVEADPSNRIFNVIGGDDEKCYCIVNNKITAVRPLPYFSTPAL